MYRRPTRFQIATFFAAVLPVVVMATSCGDSRPLGPVGAAPEREWRHVTGGITDDRMSSVWMSPAGQVYTVAGDDDVLHFDGHRWRRLDPPDPVNVVWGFDENDVWVGGPGNVSRFDGVAWKSMLSDPAIEVNDLWGPGPNELFAVGADGLLMRYNGSDWSRIESPDTLDWFAVWGSSRWDVFAVGWPGIARYNGFDWSFEESPVSAPVVDIWGTGPGNVYGVSPGAGAIVRYDGRSWSSVPVSWQNTLNDIWADGRDFVVAVGGKVLRHASEGWKWEYAGQSVHLDAVHGISNRDLVAVGTRGNMFHFDGEGWKPWYTANNPYNHYSSVFGIDSKNVFAVGANLFSGIVYYRSGSEWTEAVVSGETLYGVWAWSPSVVYAVGAGGTIIRFDGTDWTPIPSNTSETLQGVWGFGPNDIVAVGALGEIVRIQDGVASVEKSPAGNSMTDVWAGGPSSIFVGDTSGRVIYYDGERWSDMAQLSQHWGIRKLSGTSTADVFALSSESLVYHYDGDEWLPLSVQPPGQIYGIQAVAPNDVYGVGSDGVIAHYDGETWSTMDSHHFAVLWDVWGDGNGALYATGTSGAVLQYGGP